MKKKRVFWEAEENHNQDLSASRVCAVVGEEREPKGSPLPAGVDFHRFIIKRQLIESESVSIALFLLLFLCLPFFGFSRLTGANLGD